MIDYNITDDDRKRGLCKYFYTSTIKKKLFLNL